MTHILQGPAAVFYRCTPVSNPGQVVADILLTAITAVRNTGICNPADMPNRHAAVAESTNKIQQLSYETDTSVLKQVLDPDPLHKWLLASLPAQHALQTQHIHTGCMLLSPEIGWKFLWQFLH